jgi:hypothetical protein
MESIEFLQLIRFKKKHSRKAAKGRKKNSTQDNCGKMIEKLLIILPQLSCKIF